MKFFVNIMALVSVFLSILVVLTWCFGFRDLRTDPVIGGCIAILYPFVDAVRRRPPPSIELSHFVWDALLMGIPAATIIGAHHTVPLLVMATVFVTGALMGTYALNLVDKLLVATAFAFCFGMLGRADLGPDWMNLYEKDLVLLALMIPGAIITTLYAGKPNR